MLRKFLVMDAVPTLVMDNISHCCDNPCNKGNMHTHAHAHAHIHTHTHAHTCTDSHTTYNITPKTDRKNLIFEFFLKPQRLKKMMIIGRCLHTFTKAPKKLFEHKCIGSLLIGRKRQLN